METAQGLVAVGVAGMNLEDSVPHGPGEPLSLVPLEDYLGKIAALQQVKQTLGCGSSGLR